MPAKTLSAKEARSLILAGDAPARLTVEDDVLNLKSAKIAALPKQLECYELDASKSQLESIPASLRVECALHLQDCKKLTKLPKGLEVGTLDVSGCNLLVRLPEGLDVWFLRAARCPRLKSLPQQATIRHGGLDVSRCEQLAALPDYLGDLATLDISDCPGIRELPGSLRVTQWVDIAGSGVTEMQPPIDQCQLRWHGVPISEQAAFRPETLTAKDCLKEQNAEIRRVMIERMGFDEFVRDAGGKRLDADTDPGGKRELIRVPLKDDEDIVCLSCSCPSTGRHYLLRVPPTIKKAHEAAAWMAGFDDPAEYQPLVET